MRPRSRNCRSAPPRGWSFRRGADPGSERLLGDPLGLGGESKSSPVVTWILDQMPPKIELSAPKDGATINRATIEVLGHDAGPEHARRPEDANNASVTGGGERWLVQADPATRRRHQQRGRHYRPRRATRGVSPSGGVRPARRGTATPPPPAGPAPHAATGHRSQRPATRGAAVTFVATAPGLPPVTFETVPVGRQSDLGDHDRRRGGQGVAGRRRPGTTTDSGPPPPGRPSPSRRSAAAAAIGDYHQRMPMWRCPHCGTPQTETSRCWVCKRSSTSCGTCRHSGERSLASLAIAASIPAASRSGATSYGAAGR